ncbi:MAG: hypothetical protein IK137_02285 [Bacilli bacterium]|nr:hypothetical protein [Bacilli bacterium]
MDDPEFKQMVHKAIFAVTIALVFAIPLFFVFKNKFTIKEDQLLKSINNKETVFIYIIEDKCDNCKTLKKELDNKKIKYKILNKDTNQNYKKIINMLGFYSSNMYIPALIYVKDGEVQSFIVDINNKKALNEYIENYK